MKTINMIELPLNMTRRMRPRWTHLILAAMIAFGVGVVGQGVAAPGNNPSTPVLTKPNKPILTKSGKKAALKAAAAAITQAQALPTSPTDGTKVPHYFGPFPNWANSPFTLPDVVVTINGDGTGATASATVGANGAVTGITITNPGSGYTSASVVFTGAGTLAAADAVVTPSGAVTAITINAGGTGYTAPQVTFSDVGATTDATATAYGGVDAVALTTPGSGYTNPTVDFDMPDGADGVKAVAHAECDSQLVGCGTLGAITAIVVDEAGSGYSHAPNVVIRNGTLYDPVAGGTGATATATLEIQTVALDTFGAGYTTVPTVAITDPSPAAAGASATAAINAGLVTAINLTAGGSGYITAGGMKKFQDGLPGLCNPSVAGSCVANNLGQYIPLAVPDTTTFTTANGFAADADYYAIALVQHRERMSSSLPAKGTLLREYVQLETPANASWSKHIPSATRDSTAPAAIRSFTQVQPRQCSPWTIPTTWARSSRRRKIGRSESRSTTFCPPATVGICTSPRTPR